MSTNRQWAAIFFVTLTMLLLLATALPAMAAVPQTGAARPASFATPEPTMEPPSGDSFLDMIKLFGYNIGLFVQNIGTFVTNPECTPVPAILPPYCCTETPVSTCTPVAPTKTPVPPTSVPPTSVPATEAPTVVSPVSVIPPAVLPAAFLPVTGGDPLGANFMSLLPVFALLLLALPGLRALRRRP